MKHIPYTLILILAAFFAGLAWNSNAATSDCGGLYCTSTSVTTTKLLLADAGFLSTQSANFSGGLYAWKGANSISVDEYTANLQGASGRSAIVMDWTGAGSGTGITAIGSIFEGGNSTYLTIDDINQVVTITNMPTSDPHITNALYSVDGVIHISSGP